MSDDKDWKFDFGKYIKQGEPDRIEKSEVWQTAIGLQAVDGLKTSQYCEGNTRVTAVFIIKYLKTFGFHIGNDVFAENSWYFRNALVRANYNDMPNGIHATTKYLELFFENLLTGKHNELKNRYLHLDYKEIL